MQVILHARFSDIACVDFLCMCTRTHGQMLATHRMPEAEEVELDFDVKLNVNIRTRARTLMSPATTVSLHFAALTHLADICFSLEQCPCISNPGFCVCVVTEIDGI